MHLTIFLFLIGLVILILGSNFLIVGASNFAKALHISPLIVGLTILSFGTSSPEIGVSAVGAWKGEGGLVLGGITGSNILNILLILGICSLVSAPVIKKRIIWLEIPLMIGISLAFWGMAATGTFTRIDGVILFSALLLYLLFVIFQERKGEKEKSPPPSIPLWLQILFMVGGLVLLAFGAEMLVDNGVKIARFLQISELYIGLTLIALGTSLPELVTSLVAIRKKEGDLAIGNIIGSNIFNLLGVTGIAALVKPIEVPKAAIHFDIPIMVGVAIATLPIFWTGHKVSRWEGALFLFYYLLYLTYLILHSSSHRLFSLFTTALLFFILPLTVITLGIGVYRHLKAKG
ncbi:MAG: Inner membrane protein YrbG [Chlamydiae bacterium]|nr:Inner membrane protein YrbG [Chlamydiota bacterium]